MNSCSVKLTFSDDDFYYNFIDPRRINGELPTLVLRLLTAYATNDELACQIDQYVDRGDPEVYEARELLLSALTGLNTLSAMTKQALEANDAIANGDTDTDGDDTADAADDDAVDIEAMMDGADVGTTGDADVVNAAMLNAAFNSPVDIPMPHILDRSADAVTADMLNSALNSPVDIPMPHIPDRSASKTAAEPIAPATPATTAKSEPVVVQQDNTEVMNAIGLLTQQVSALTGSVSSLIDVMKTDAYKPQEGGVSVGGKLTLPEEENANTGNSEGSTMTLELQAKTASEKQERTKLADEVAKGTVRVVYVDSTTKTLMKPEDVEALGAPAVEEVTKVEPAAVKPEPVAPAVAEPIAVEPTAVEPTAVEPTAVEPIVAKAEPTPIEEKVEPVKSAPAEEKVELVKPAPVEEKPVAKAEPEPVVAKSEPVAEEPEQTGDDEYEVSVPDFLTSMMASLDTPDEEAGEGA